MLEKKVCIIGAGSSGITAAKALHEANIDFDCFEKGSNIGGNWLYNNDNGVSSAYHSLHINTSKQLMAFSDFPMPDDYPDYPGHQLIYTYFENYINHFGFRDKITFNTSVEKIEKLAANHYLVYTDKFPPKEYSDVFIANGHHWSIKMPEFPGNFSGEILHSHHYKTYHHFQDKKVLIVGIGNSAVDIAGELTTVSRSVTVSTRSGAHILPKYLFGVPTDHLSKPPLAFAPLSIQRLALKLSLFLNVGNQTNYGLPKPKRKLLGEHPTISQEFLNKVGHGKICIKPNIAKLDGNMVYFEDGTSSYFDVIIYCTGYKIEFPFLPKELFNVENNEMPLYEYTVDTQNPGLYHIGLIQPLGAVMPLAELQAVWIANIISGKTKLPTKEFMQKWITNNRNAMRKRFGNSTRHTLEVEFFPFMKKLKQLAKKA